VTYEALRPWLIVPHGALGGVVLLLGVVVLVTKKGTPQHVKLGRAFYWSMVGSIVLAIPLMLLRGNHFLLLLSILSFYMLVSGRREVQRHKAKAPFSAFDRGFTLLTLVASVGLVGWGIQRLVTRGSGGFTWVFIGLGALGVNLAWDAWRRRDGPPRHRLAWMEDHVGMMIGCFIAATTAFSSVNLSRVGGIPVWVIWLGPSILLVPLIVRETRRIRAMLGD